MRYTPEELIEYIKENDLELKMMTAIYNNDRGLSIMEIEPNFVKKDSKIFIDIELGGIGLVELGKADEVRAIEPIDGYENVAFLLKAWDSELSEDYYRVMTAYLDKSKDRDDECLEAMFHIVLTDLEINTKGKLKVFIEKGLGRFRQYCDTMNYLESLADEDSFL
jgi:hypothetical protein